MGSLCGTASTQERAHNNRYVVRNLQVPNINRTERDRQDNEDKFKDMEEFNSKDNYIYIDGKMIGQGIKHIPAYKCKMSDTELNRLREEFWSKYLNYVIFLLINM